jgi:hypothetical protein
MSKEYGGLSEEFVPPLTRIGSGRQFLYNQAAYRVRSNVSLASLGVGTGGETGYTVDARTTIASASERGSWLGG